MEKHQGSVSIHAHNIMPIIKKWLYSDKDIFIRELVSNACDAVTKHRLASGSAGEDYAVRVELDAQNRTLRFIDNGIGMTADEVERYISQVAFSGAEEFMKRYGEGKADQGGIIGHFGLGFYSAFMVADLVRIDTLSYQAGAQPVSWQSLDGMTYEVGDSAWDKRGTCITLHLNPDEDEFTKAYRVREVLDRYCAFMATPIYFEEVGQPQTEKAADEVKEGEVAAAPEAPKPINDTNPLWLQKPSDCTEEAYKALYQKVFHDYEEPLFWVHLNVDYPFNLKGILYFPKIKQDFGGMEGQIKLFSGQVFVADNIKEVIPEFLMLLKGVIDCPDFPLNVSRSFLQNDGYVKKLSTHITKKVADRLTGMFTHEREQYERYWPDISPFIKYGCMRDDKFAERMKPCLLFKKIDGTFVTLEEYQNANREKTGDKVLYTPDVNRQKALVDLYQEQGIDVVVLDTPIDVNFISYMEYSGKDEKTKFVRVDADAADFKQEGPSEVKVDVDRLTKLVRRATGSESLKVEAHSLKTDEIPAMLIESEQSRRFKDMSRMYGDMKFAMPDDFTIVFNDRHPVVRAISEMVDEEQAQLMAHQVYDLAKLTAAPLDPEEMAAFVKRSTKLLSMAAGAQAE